MRSFNQKWLVFLIAGIALCLNCVATEPGSSGQRKPKLTEAEQEARRYIRKAYSNLKEGNFNQAVQDVSEAIRLTPDGEEGATAYSLRAYVFNGKGDYDQAIDDATEAIRLFPDGNKKVADAYRIRAISYAKKANYDQAIEDFTSAIRILPNIADLYIERAEIHTINKNYDRTIEDLSAAIRMRRPTTTPAVGRIWVKATITARLTTFLRRWSLSPIWWNPKTVWRKPRRRARRRRSECFE